MRVWKGKQTMITSEQKEKAAQFKGLHGRPGLLVLPNAWDAASAAVIEQAGFPAIATTSSGVAASLGYPDGEQISRDMLVEAVARITRVVACPVTVDVESGFGATRKEALATIRAIIDAGAVGINIEDSIKGVSRELVDPSEQAELLRAIRELADTLDIPLVINARTDIYLMMAGDESSRFEQAVQRARAYQQAGADCFFPIGLSDALTITELVKQVGIPINILAGSATPSLPGLERMGVRRVSFGSGPMRAALGLLRRLARELLESGTITGMSEGALTGGELRALFP